MKTARFWFLITKIPKPALSVHTKIRHSNVYSTYFFQFLCDYDAAFAPFGILIVKQLEKMYSHYIRADQWSVDILRINL